MADLSFVWNMDDGSARALAQTRLDHAITETRELMHQQGSEWCVDVSDAIADMKRDECPEVEMIGILAQIGMLSVLVDMPCCSGD